MRRSDIAGIVVAIIAIPGGLGYLYHRASMAPQPMENGELLRTARQLASDARESARLAKLSATGQVNVHYARVQHDKLAEDVHDAMKVLDAPPPRGRDDDVKRARALATDMKALLAQAAPQLADPNALAQLEDRHSSIAAELERIATTR